jgi:hypothetical protein
MYSFIYIQIHILEVRVKQLEKQAAEKEAAGKEAAKKGRLRRRRPRKRTTMRRNISPGGHWKEAMTTAPFASSVPFSSTICISIRTIYSSTSNT